MTGFGDFVAICVAVLSDYRVIAIAAATILAWAVLRYVGMVYSRRVPRRRTVRSSPLAGRPSGSPRSPER